ncbi:MAG: 1-acyl-sn-glycerol-3-phosphate acyltransferase [Alphaproteobacteria bacterium]|nr:1-acyl-sn-glycerol-3-phosphate acyltransferase [Alphaproteobacteria bacterium]
MSLIRSAAFNAFFFGVTFLMAMASLPLRVVAPQFVPAYARAWARLMLAALRMICGIRYEVTGRDHLPKEGAALLAPMHQSAFDTVIWMLLLPRPAYVVKAELFRIPLFGPLLRLAGMIPVDRRGGAAALRSLLQAADGAIAAGRQIVIFPEGTRVAPGKKVALQPGVAALAARTGMPVIPVATDSGRHWGRRAFRKVPGVIHVALQPPLDPGLPRAALLADLQRAFTDGEAAFGAHVDNSVGEPAAGLL